MNVLELEVPGVRLVEPDVFGDARGFFMESYNTARYATHGIAETFVQDNVSRSVRGVLRGLHLQHPFSQAKLVSVLEGAVFDVAVDVRVGSPHFGKWVGAELSADNRRQLYVPAGFAHGFQVISESALFVYKCSELYHPEADLSVAWDDPDIGIEWPLADAQLSRKDAEASRLSQIPASRLPSFESG